MELAFILKKIISIFIMPLSLGVVLLILAFLYLRKRSYTKSKFLLSIGIIWLMAISYLPFSNYLLYKLESTYPTLHTPPKEIEYIYVLGNSHHTDNNHPITSQVHEISSVRLSEAIRLYRLLDEKPTIILSGYSGLFDPTSGALMQKRLALALGIKESSLHLEPSAKDTKEEAVAAKMYIKDKPFILVTSASHMRRAINFFEAQNLHPIPAPTNHLANIKHINYLAIFSTSAIRNITIFWHEILGLLWQKIKGISSV
jgi:uncharacterized SAM-binding protein YcdF (DUF218 family)